MSMSVPVIGLCRSKPGIPFSSRVGEQAIEQEHWTENQVNALRWVLAPQRRRFQLKIESGHYPCESQCTRLRNWQPGGPVRAISEVCELYRQGCCVYRAVNWVVQAQMKCDLSTFTIVQGWRVMGKWLNFIHLSCWPMVNSLTYHDKNFSLVVKGKGVIL